MIAVERPVTIGIVGAHSTGKTSFFAQLAHELRRHELVVSTIGHLAQQAHQIGLPILHGHSYASTLWMMTRGISDEVGAWPHCDVLLVDRAVPDALGYYLAALNYRGETPDPVEVAQLRNLAAAHVPHYDQIFRTALNHSRPLGTEKSRDNDPTFRELADHHVRSVLAELRIPHRVLRDTEHADTVTASADFVLDRLTSAREEPAVTS